MNRVGGNSATILDLDNPATWESAFLPLMQKPEVQEVMRICRSQPYGEALLGQLEAGPEGVEDSAFEQVQKLCVELLFSRFTHVIACHGCRVADPVDYLSKGLLRSDPHELVANLIRCATEMEEQIRTAADDLGTGYFQWNRGTVGFLLSQRWAIGNRTHYSYGSELIQGIIHRVGPELAHRYVLTGRPSLIRCRIPVEWIRDNSLTEGTLQTYATKPLAKLILDELLPSQDDEPIGTNGGFRLARDIPPDLIEAIIDMSGVVDDASWIRSLEVKPSMGKVDWELVNGVLEIELPKGGEGTA